MTFTAPSVELCVTARLKLLCFPAHRRTSGRTEAGERPEEAAGRQEAGAALQGERPTVSEPTPQEPR